jgi:hypothetical protein
MDDGKPREGGRDPSEIKTIVRRTCREGGSRAAISPAWLMGASGFSLAAAFGEP